MTIRDQLQEVEDLLKESHATSEKVVSAVKAYVTQTERTEQEFLDRVTDIMRPQRVDPQNTLSSRVLDEMRVRAEGRFNA